MTSHGEALGLVTTSIDSDQVSKLWEDYYNQDYQNIMNCENFMNDDNLVRNFVLTHLKPTDPFAAILGCTEIKPILKLKAAA
jgi:hypothetical protein